MHKQIYSFDRLHPEAELSQGLTLMSKNQAYFAFIQSNGLFSIYVSGHFVNSNLIWQANDTKKGEKPYSFSLKTDGNLVVLDKKKAVLWESATGNQGKPPFQLIMQDDGNLVLYDSVASPLWCVGMIDR